MTDSPLDKIQTDPTPMPDLGVELKPKGSPPGEVTFWETVCSFARFWSWHLAAMTAMFVEIAAGYLNSNIGLVAAKYGFVIASVVFGITGVIKGYRDMLAKKAADTRQVEIK